MNTILFVIYVALVVTMTIFVIDGLLRRTWSVVIAAAASIATMTYIQYAEASWLKLALGVAGTIACYLLWRRVERGQLHNCA